MNCNHTNLQYCNHGNHACFYEVRALYEVNKLEVMQKREKIDHATKCKETSSRSSALKQTAAIMNA